MGTLAARLEQKKAAILERWLGDTLATYPKDGAAAFRREKDPFANPVGHALRVGTRATLEAVVEGKDPAQACSCLEDIIRIRAVQEFTPGRALSFVFLLKDAVRAELGRECREAPLAEELAGFESHVDQMALHAFDLYVRRREQVCELRVNEVKRSVAKMVERMNRRGSSPELENDLSQLGASTRDDAQRGGGP